MWENGYVFVNIGIVVGEAKVSSSLKVREVPEQKKVKKIVEWSGIRTHAVSHYDARCIFTYSSDITNKNFLGYEDINLSGRVRFLDVISLTWSLS